MRFDPLLALALAGCATSGGVSVDAASLALLEKGRTTYVQAVARLGRPSVDTASPDGRRILIYKSQRMRVRPETALPVLGSVLGGTEEDSEWVTLFFRRDGVIEDWTVERERTIDRGFGAGKRATALPPR